MQKAKQYSNWFFYLNSIIISLIGIIISIGIAFYFMNHNSLKDIDSKSEYLKDNINSKSEHLKENINQAEKKVDEFKQETQINFNKLDEALNNLEHDLTQKQEEQQEQNEKEFDSNTEDNLDKKIYYQSDGKTIDFINEFNPTTRKLAKTTHFNPDGTIIDIINY
ncbi:DUF2963 domain-containing protein [Candidatus Phytoplasma solani]|uniref:DUF2963 domain-containing protein n=1 Tax=Candidatus Phytoplasma solani TaxID=69896 RepID=UPI00358F2715